MFGKIRPLTGTISQYLMPVAIVVYTGVISFMN